MTITTVIIVIILLILLKVGLSVYVPSSSFSFPYVLLTGFLAGLLSTKPISISRLPIPVFLHSLSKAMLLNKSMLPNKAFLRSKAFLPN